MKPLMSYRTYTRTPFWLLPLLLGLFMATLPLLGVVQSDLRIIVSICLLSLIVIGLNVTFGYAGELALGQTVMYAAGAYTAGYFATQGFGLGVTMLIAVVAAGLIGLLTGIPGMRIGSWSLAMLTFFLVLLIPDVLNLTVDFTGAAEGLVGIPFPTVFGTELDNASYYMVVIAVTIVVFALFRNYVVSRHGGALTVLRESPVLAKSLGMSVFRTKLVAYMLGSLPAGIAGSLFAYQDGYISPGSFGFSAAVAVLAAAIIGGTTSVYGALFGAAVLTLGPLRSSFFQEWSLVFFGLILVIGGLAFTGGVAGLLRSWVRRHLVGDDLLPDVVAALEDRETRNPEPVPGEVLHVRGISKSFGGNRALSAVDIEVPAGSILGLIGPNGSGKTTLLNIVSGFYQPDEGTITLGGRDLAQLDPHQVARAGVSRTFQTPVIPVGMTVADVVASARTARLLTSVITTMLRLPAHRRVAREDRVVALRLLADLGIAELADRSAADLALGTTRLVEVARALAGNPSLVLLDEPASGLDEHEVEVLAALVLRLRDAGATVVLVEHNFEMVMRVADQVSVLALGEVIASGPPATVRNDPAVVESYLGKQARERMDKAGRGA